MLDRLEQIYQRYLQLNKELSDPNIVSNIKKMTELSKESRSLEKIVDKYLELKKVLNEITDLKEMVHDKDKEIQDMAREDLNVNLEKKEKLEEDIKILLIPKDENDERDVMVEIRGAVGGDEANIFAGDLFRMYSKYAESKGWKIEVLNSMPSDMGGFSQIEFRVSGENVYSYLKYESGAHRVQRVPETESMGRVHTSTATVLVLPEADELEVNLDPNDVRIDIFCSSGPGGQSVNTTKSAVRVTHIPTGIVVSCQDGKSQHENKAQALRILNTRLYDFYNQQKLEKEGEVRKKLIGQGDRSEKIRTYNYPQNRVTDHRIGFTIQRLDAIIDGKLDLVIDKLIEENQRRLLSKEE